MKKFITVLLIKILLLSSTASLSAKYIWKIEGLFGDAFCFRTPLTIKQNGFETIKIMAKYETNSFAQPIYYSVRFSKFKNNRAWEIELIHLKIELLNKPSEIQRFEISHGYNLLTLNRAWYLKKIVLRFGCGVVISHPENTIRGKSLSENKGIMNKGYYISGPVIQPGVGRIFHVNKKLFLLIEGKMTISYGRIPIKDGHAIVPNFTIHALSGIGFKF